MNSIPTATTRKTVYDNAMNYQGSQEQQDDINAANEAKRLQLQQNIGNYICEWACTSDYKTNQACNKELLIPTSQIDENVLAEWETTLRDKGYSYDIVNEHTVKISFPTN